MAPEKPVFLQIVEMIEDEILRGFYQPGDMIISTTQIAKLLSVNPTTAVKAVSILTERGIVCKKRGLGMAVTETAKALILAARKKEFYNHMLPGFIEEAEKIGIAKPELIRLIAGETND